MNIRFTLLTGILTFFVIFNGISQEVSEKSYFDSDKKLGGDITLKSSVIKTEGTKTYKIFEFESPDNGNYFLNVWLMGGERGSFGSGAFTEYELTVNNEKQDLKLKPDRNNWHNVGYKDGKTKEKKAVKLKAGLNQVAFSCDAPEIPDIEFIRLSKDKNRSEISESRYNTFISEIRDEVTKRIKTPVAKKDSSVQELKSGVVLSNPEGNYYHHMGINFRYTTYKVFSFSAGQQVFFSTNATDGYDHVLEVFSTTNPEAYTWVNMSNSVGLASLNISIPVTGTYYVRIRAYRQETQGLVNLNVNGQYFYTDCAVSGSGFAHSHDTPTTYNYFTCKLTGDSHIWIEDNSSFPGKIRAFNDDYNTSEPHDFYWGLASRVKKDLPGRVSAVLVSAYSSYNPTGICDLYVMCRNSTIGSAFPNLKADDAIQSAPQSYIYNCISWSGGITEYWEWPPSQFSAYYVPNNPLASFDNFYKSGTRYNVSDQMTYSQSGATTSNSVIDLWYNPNYYSLGNGAYTHASVTKPGNNHPHGYDWESKPGALMRTFHPRNSLNNTDPGGYGVITNYYIITSGLKSAILLSESIARGHSVIENVEFTENEEQLISESLDKLTPEQINSLGEKYSAWEETWDNPKVAIYSNPREYAKNEQYVDFIEYCKSIGEVSWPFVFDRFEQGGFFAINAVEDLTLDDNMDILEKVKADSQLKSATESGATIVRSPETFTMKYIKELLKATGNTVFGIEGDKGIIYSNSFDFNIYPNPTNTSSQIAFDLPSDARVTIDVLDLTGRVLSVPVSNVELGQGYYCYGLDLPRSFKGTCLVRLRIDRNINVQLLIVE
ncbi:MAG: hypothetical protein ACK5M7_00665 [Draconibacterium sp.]